MKYLDSHFNAMAHHEVGMLGDRSHGACRYLRISRRFVTWELLLRFGWPNFNRQGILCSYVFSLGETRAERVTILDAADWYDRLRKDLDSQVMPSAADYLAQRRALHDRQVPGPTVSMGWSAYVAGESGIVSTRLLLLGASGTRIYNAFVKRLIRYRVGKGVPGFA